jgi:hypothetical protein
MIPLTLDSLYDSLTQSQFDVKRQPETNQLYVLFKVLDQEYPIFIRVMDEGELLQLLAFMPVSLDAKTIPDVARLLHLFNKEIDIPGFGMDEKAKVNFYRVILPGIEGEVSGKIIAGYINSIKMITETFYPVIAAVATGQVTYADVLKKANQLKA